MVEENSKIFIDRMKKEFEKEGLKPNVGLKIYYNMFKLIKRQLVLYTNTVNFIDNRIKVIVPYLFSFIGKNRNNERLMREYIRNKKYKKHE